jgi:hypothetical protein
MITDITQNELVLLAYNELPPKEHEALMSLVLNDSELSKAYFQIKDQMDNLDTVMYQPNPTSVQIVLEESCNSSSLEVI